MPDRKVKKVTKKVRPRNRAMVQFRKAPLPNQMGTKLRYCETVIINPGIGGTAGVHVFSANGMYDPNITGTGHQPRGFDQLLGSLYDHFTVIGSRITVDFAQQYNTAYNVMTVGIALKDSTSVYADVNDYQEGRNVVTSQMPSSNQADSGNLRRCVKTFSARGFLGRSHPLSDPELKGSSSANPTEQAYYHVFAAGHQGQDEAAIECIVRIEYMAILTEPRNPSQS